MPRDLAPTSLGDRLPAHGEHRPRGSPRPNRRGWVRAGVLIAVHLAVLAHLAHWRVAGRTMTPLEPSEAMQTLELGWVNAGALLLVASIALTLVLGRFFCGWACHVVAYQDLCAWLLGRVGLRPRPVRSRLLMLVPLGAAFYMFAWPSLARALRGEDWPPFVRHFTTEDFWATFPGPGIALATLVVDGALIVWILGAKGFCTYGCPYGALFGLADRFARGRIRVSDACEGCGQCTAVCTSNVRVQAEVARFGMVVDPGCMKCMDCVSSCPTNALSFGFGPSRAGVLRGKPAAAARWDFGWGEELALAAVFLAALYAFRGLCRVVPFLLAIGLALLCAVAALALVRTLSRRDFTLQHWTLRSGGRLRPAGATALVGCGALLALTAHSGVVQFDAREGERNLVEAGSLTGPARRERVLEAREHLARARRLGLVGVGALELQLGAVEAELGDRPTAEAHYRRALELDGELRNARLALADLLILRGERDGARELLRELLELEPGHAGASLRLERLGGEPAR
ncbi:MAG TPA: 4Fe-4S binding protein [Planctomycetota bacterium]|nr:4Fe-4S binding protein [Planctomycetota bacterium]